MLKLTNLADYGIVLMTHLVTDGTFLNASQLAAKTELPVPTVSKILGILSRGRLLRSERGLKGGFTLTRPAADISLTDIIEVIDGPIAFTQCSGIGEFECRIESSCSIQPHWTIISSALRGAFDQISLLDMTGKPDDIAPSLKLVEKTFVAKQ